MARIVWVALLSIIFSRGALLADEVAYRYEGDFFPSTTEGWITGLGKTCTQLLSNGFLINSWPAGQGSYSAHQRIFGDSSNPPPGPPFWIEWRFASNNAIHGSFLGDGQFILGYLTAAFHLSMYGDSIIWQEGGTYVLDLPLNEFRTYRFESLDGIAWCAWFDGKLFLCSTASQSGESFFRMAGSGGSPYATTNRWDFVRYGRVTTGETIVASNPPAGYLDPAKYHNLDRFTVTFDQPNYVYIDDIVVDGEGSEAARQPDIGGNEPRTSVRADSPVLMTQADFENPGADLFLKTSPQVESPRGMNSAAREGIPMVTATRRQDNGPPETVEIVLDRPLTAGATYRFTFNTGAATPQTVTYTMTPDPHPVIPTTTTWGLIVLSLLLAIAAKLRYSGLHPSV